MKVLRGAAFVAAGLAIDASPARAVAPPEFVPALEAPALASPRFVLSNPVAPTFGLDRFAHPDVERVSSSRTFLEGRYGAATWHVLPELTLGAPAEGHAPLELPVTIGAQAAPLLADDPFRLTLDFLEFSAPKKATSCTKRAIRFARMGGESDVFSLLGCDGSILPDALDRLSVMARPTGIERPPVPLPDDPDPAAASGEWIESVRLLHPRLAWAVQQIAEAFPWREIYLISGYRRPGAGHAGLHAQGRAIDLFVMNVPNERVYALCRKLRDVGCGYYPNNKFVHVDVRRPGTGHAYWVDDSAPGEPSHYVDGWPGVEANVPKWMSGAP